MTFISVLELSWYYGVKIYYVLRVKICFNVRTFVVWVDYFGYFFQMFEGIVKECEEFF